MEDIMVTETVSNDSDEDVDFTARKKHGKQALRIDETDSEGEELENCTTPEDPLESNEIVGGSNPDEDSNESKESSDDGENISMSTQRKKKRRKRKSVEEDVNDEVLLLLLSSLMLAKGLLAVNVSICVFGSYLQHKSKMNALCDEDSSSDESDHRQIETAKTTKTERAPQRVIIINEIMIVLVSVKITNFHF